jgi:hypothetical protein
MNRVGSLAVGAYAGAGVGVFFTNAGSVTDLRGPFNTVDLNVPFGGLEFAWSQENTWIVSMLFGPGQVASASRLTTTTATPRGFIGRLLCGAAGALSTHRGPPQ